MKHCTKEEEKNFNCATLLAKLHQHIEATRSMQTLASIL